MKCYICEKDLDVGGGTRYGVGDAVGICHDCGIGVCLEHSRKSAQPGSPLLCPECARKRVESSVQPSLALAHSKV
jgi:hypothetical protein